MKKLLPLLLIFIISCRTSTDSDVKQDNLIPVAPLYVIKVQYIGEEFDSELDCGNGDYPTSKFFLVTLSDVNLKNSITFKTKVPSLYPVGTVILK